LENEFVDGIRAQLAETSAELVYFIDRLFGIPLAITESAPILVVGARIRCEVMNELGDFSNARYAVIRALRTEGGPECLVIAYPDEETLHGLIAAPSIIGLRFSSREEAAASIEGGFPTSGGSKSEKYRHGVRFATRRFGDWIGLAGTRRMVRRAMQQATAGAVVLFYSTNAVAAAFRSFLGA
jgi:hypothetical protein